MRQTHLFTKTRKEAPADETAKNAQLLIRAGYVSKEMAGVYAYLPLGLRVQKKIKQIIREEMDNLGGQELLMTALQAPQIWQKTGRWDDEVVDCWFKTKLKNDTELGLAWSHEEPIGEMMKNHISSYKDLPIYVYQFQNKLRNELRSKSGVMRGREFVMKDAYSFCLGEADHNEIYENSKAAYMKVFNRLGIGDDTYITFASGGAFTKFSHEFQTVTVTGEDVCYINQEKRVAINEEVLNDETLNELGIKQVELTKTNTTEVGNIFNFGRQKAEELGLQFTDEAGRLEAVWMGSYGIGVTRLMGVLVEKFSDDKGIVWPKNVAPFAIHLVGLNGDDAEVRDYSDGIYNTLKSKGVDVLYDDRPLRPGEKFTDSDLLGLTYRVVVSKKTKADGRFEVVERMSGHISYMTEAQLFATMIA